MWFKERLLALFSSKNACLRSGNDAARMLASSTRQAWGIHIPLERHLFDRGIEFGKLTRATWNAL